MAAFLLLLISDSTELQFAISQGEINANLSLQMMAGSARFTFNYTVRGAPEACTYAMLGLMWSSDHRHLAIVGISKFSCTGLMKNCISALTLALSKFIFLLGRRAIFFALLRWCNNIDINNFIAVKAICCQHFFLFSPLLVLATVA